MNNNFTKTNIENILPLSAMQEGMLFHHLSNPDSHNYLEQICIEINSELIPRVLQEAWQVLVDNHEMLRTVFKWNNVPHPMQVSLKQFAIAITNYNFSNEPLDQAEKNFAKIIKEDRQKQIDLTKEPLRIILSKITANKYRMIITNHHILFDGWSCGIILHQLFTVYMELIAGQQPTRIVQGKYRDYLTWCNKQDRKNQKKYWQQYLVGYNNEAKLSTNSKGGKQVNKYHTAFLTTEQTEKLKQFTRDKGITMAALLYTAWGLLLQRYTNSNDVVFGTTVSGRAIGVTNIENIVGLFINTLPLRIKTSSEQRVIRLIETITHDLNRRLEFEQTPLVDIQTYGKQKELFDSIVVIENYPMPKADNGLQINLHSMVEETHYPLTIGIMITETIAINFIYDTQLFDKQTVMSMADHYLNIINAIITDANCEIRNLNMLNKKECQEILYDFNATEKKYPKHKLIHQLFEEQAVRTPLNKAVISHENILNYQTLNIRANQLSYFLRQQKIMPNDFVAVLLERSALMVEATLGILKSGAAYVPLDPTSPPARVVEIIAELNIKHIITQSSLLRYINKFSWQTPKLQNILLLDIEGDVIRPETLDQDNVAEFWDLIAEKAVDKITAGGFISTYTSEAFTQAQVAEYQGHVNKIAHPYLNQQAKVLEIGCGSGMLMYQFAPDVAHYVGMDPSSLTQQKNQQLINKSKINNIELITGYAHEINNLQPSSFDIIILASTIQFFPGPIYLTQVITDAMRLLVPGGILICSDIMDAAQKENFVNSVTNFAQQHKNILTKTDFDSELYLHENYFIELTNCNSQIADCKVIYRAKKFTSELKYRYDVVLRKAQKSTAPYSQMRFPRATTQKKLSTLPNSNLIPVSQPGDTAYVIYTSGSTGKQKGVIINHKTVVNLIDWVNNTFKINTQDMLLFVTSLCFDLSVYDIFGILAAGGTIRVASENELQDPDKLIDILNKEPITFWDSAPAALQRLVPLFQDNKIKQSTLRLAFFSGDWIPLNFQPLLKQTFPGIKVIGLGGATEATIWSNYFPIKEVASEWKSIPYGKPIQNAKYYILDRDLNPMPLGIAGDLYIGGDCLACGYANDAKLTAAKFINNPFFKDPCQRIYKTGDIARLMPNDLMEFLGRQDNQVKIRGYRVELGEIESHLLKHIHIKQALVTAQENHLSEKSLIAYIQAPQDLSQQAVKKYLATRLPAYMIPAFVIMMDEFPVTMNGKLDHKALPKPQRDLDSPVPYVGPRDKLECELIVIWKKLLGIDQIGIDDNFFDIGGNSLLIMTLASRVHKQFAIAIPLPVIFKLTSIRELAYHIKNNAPEQKYYAIKPTSRQKSYLASSAQRRIYYLQELDKSSVLYNMPGALIIDGDLDVTMLQQALKRLVKRHELLFTSFELQDNKLIQCINQDIAPNLHHTRNTTDRLDTIIAECIKPFDLNQAPLLRTYIIEIGDGKHLLLCDIHHIISDGISMDILMKDLMQLYASVELPTLTLQYKDYSVWHNHLIQTGQLEQQEEYWLNVFACKTPSLDLFFDGPPSNITFAGNTITLSLNPQLSTTLTRYAKQAGITLYMLFLSAYNVLLAQYTGRDDITIGCLFDGRTQPELENVIGMFVNILPMRNHPARDKTINGFLQEVKENTLQAYTNSAYPFDMLVEKLNLKRDAHQNPLVETIISFGNRHFVKMPQESNNITFTPYNVANKSSKFNLTLDVSEGQQGFDCHLGYKTDLYSTATAETFLENFKKILTFMTTNKTNLLGEIDLFKKEKIIEAKTEEFNFA